MSKLKLLEKKIERERSAREQAEELLEKKSAELYETNQRILEINDQLEQRVADRTLELNMLASFPREAPNPIMRMDRHGNLSYKNEAAEKLLNEFGLSNANGAKIFGVKISDVYERGRICDFDLLLGKVVFNFRLTPMEGGGYVNAYGRDVTNERKFIREIEEERDRANRASQAKSQFLANMSHEIRTPLNGMLGFVQVLKKTELTETQARHLQTIASSGEMLLGIINDILEFSRIEAGHLDVVDGEFDLRDMVEDVASILAVRAQEKKLELPVYVNGDVAKQIFADSGRLRQVLMNLVGNAIKFTHFGEVAIDVEVENEKLVFTVSDSGVGIPEDKLGEIFKSFSQTDETDTRKYGGTGLGLTISKKIVEAMGGEITVQSCVGSGSKFSFWVPYHPVGVVERRTVNKPVTVNLFVTNAKLEANYERIFRDMGVTVRCCKRAELFDCYVVDVDSYYLIDAEMLQNVGKEKWRRLRSNLGNARIGVIHPLGQRPEAMEEVADQFIPRPLRQNDVFSWMSEQAVKAETIENVEATECNQTRVLIVDDNLTNQLLMETVLVAEGYATEVAGNGQDAVEKWNASGGFDIVLMDLQMPVMDGFEATKQIRSTPRGQSVPVIAMTANAFRSTQEKCFSAGMTDFVTKPFKEEDLFQVFSKHLAL